MIVRDTRKVDSKGRICLPTFITKSLNLVGAEVFFEITKNGNLLVRKVEKAEKKPSSPDIDNSYNLLEPEKE